MTANFSELGLSEKIIDAINEMGWTEPTPIQIEAIPYGIEGKDLLAQAQTGTGKTGTYGSIILNNVPAENGWAHALVIAPTRELAIQVTEELEKLSKYTHHKVVSIYGGVSALKQTQSMDRGVDIIVATPGRLCDHLKDDEQLLDDVSIVVLDEADRMLDMGFRKDLEFILNKVPVNRQMLMFSATMPYDVKDLALKHLDDPKEVCVSADEPVLDLIKQYYMDVEKDDKVEMLRYVLAKEPMKTIVFCFTKYRVDKVVRKLKMSFKLAGIHGDVSQNRREDVIRSFKNDDIQVLVASDIAARGLDIENVERIINMDMPPEPDTYIHRIGRTGRAGKQGVALSFVMRDEKRLLRDIENRTLIDIEKLEVPSEEEMSRVIGNIKTLSRPALAKKNSRKNDVPVDKKEYVLAEINIGKEDQQGKASIAQIIRENTTVPKKSIGNIIPGQKTSTLEVEKKYLKAAIDGVSSCKVNDKSVKIWIVAETLNPITDPIEVPESEEKQEPRRKPRSGDRKESKYRGKSHDDRSSHSDRGHGDRRSRYSENGGRDSYRPRRAHGDNDRDEGHYDGSKSSDRDSYRPRKSYDSDRPRSSDRGERRYSDRPRRSYDSDDRGERRYSDKPRYSDRDSYRPRRSYDSDRGERHYDGPRSSDRDSYRPRRSYDSDRPRSSDRGERRYSDRPRRSFDSDRGDRKSSSGRSYSSDRPRRRYSD